jgi:hypothetical protein
MIYKIRVWERSTGEHRLAGEMICDIANNGRLTSAFRYDPDYLLRKGNFPLDPYLSP